MPTVLRRSTAILGLSLCVLLTSLTGCGFLLGGGDELAERGSEVESPAEKLVGPLTGLGGPLGAGAAGLLALINLFQAIKGRKLKQGIEAIASGIDDALEAGSKPAVSKEELYDAVKDALVEKLGDPKLVEDIIAKAKAARRAE